MPDNQHSEAVPPYLRLAQHFRRQIANGELAPGEALPSARQYSGASPVKEDARRAVEAARAATGGEAASTSTFNRMLKVLRQEGLVVSVAGTGTVVADRSAVGVDRIRGTLGNRQERIANDPYRTTQMPDWVRDQLGTDEVIVRSRRILEDGVCIQHSTSWVHPRVAEFVPEVDTMGELNPSYQRVYEQRTGQRVERTFTGHTAALETSTDVGFFLIGGAVPVARNVYADSEGVIGVGEVRHRPGTVMPVA